jgi:integrase
LTLGRFVERRAKEDPEDNGTKTLSEARSKREEYEAMILKGIDPKISTVATDTVKSIAEEFLKEKADILAFQTIKTYKSAINSKILPVLGDKCIVDVRRDEIVKLLNGINNNAGFEMMRQTKKTLSSMYSFAMDQRGTRGLEINLARDIKLAQWITAENKKARTDKRWLRATEIKLFWDFLEKHSHQINASYILLWKLILVTGCRPIEAVGMRWSDIGHHTLDDVHDLDKIDKSRLWLRPADLMKGSEPHLTYLTDLALELIQPLRHSPGDHVLWGIDVLKEEQRISRRKYGGQILKMTQGVFNKHEQRDKRRVPQFKTERRFTQHALRRTVSTQMGNLSVDPAHISYILAHKVRKGEASVTRKHYNLAEYIHEKIDALTQWDKRLREFLDLT